MEGPEITSGWNFTQLGFISYYHVTDFVKLSPLILRQSPKNDRTGELGGLGMVQAARCLVCETGECSKGINELKD